MSCKVVTARAKTRSNLINNSIIDKYNNILDIVKFRDRNTMFTNNAKERFGITKRLMFEENGKVVFNDAIFRYIDAKKGINYTENKLEQDIVRGFIPNPHFTEVEAKQALKDEILRADAETFQIDFEGDIPELQSTIQHPTKLSSAREFSLDSLQDKIGGKTFKEVWDSFALTYSEREAYLHYSLQQKLFNPDSFNGKLFAKLDKTKRDLGQVGLQFKIDYNSPAAAMADKDSITFNPKLLNEHMDGYSLPDAETYLDRIINEILRADTPILPFKEGRNPSQLQPTFQPTSTLSSERQLSLDSMQKKFSGRTFNEIWESPELDYSERGLLILRFIQEELSNTNTFNGKLFNKLSRGRRDNGEVAFELKLDFQYPFTGFGSLDNVAFNPDLIAEMMSKNTYNDPVKYLEMLVADTLAFSGTLNKIQISEVIERHTNYINSNQSNNYNLSQAGDYINPELKSTLLAFLKKINPDFKVETLNQLNDHQGLTVSGVTKLNQWLIQLREGQEGSLPEEVAHVLVELLDKNSKLYKEMDDNIVYTKMYAKVIAEYGNHPEYKGNYAKLRREATAKLISLYLQDKALAEKMMGSPTLIGKIVNLIKQIIDKFRGIKNPFQQASLRIMSNNISDILLENALKAEAMYALTTYEDVEAFQTLDHNTSDFETVFININDSILDLANYSIPDRPSKSDPSKTTKGKYIKSNMWFSPHFTADLDTYYTSAKLTKLGRELRDKIKLAGKSKFFLYTDAPLTQSLLDRLEIEFGIDPSHVIRTSTEKEMVTDAQGNVEIKEGPDKVAILESHAAKNGKTLFVDNKRNPLFNSTNAEYDFVYYNNSRVKYTDYRELIKRRELEELDKAITDGTLAEFKKIDKDTIVQFAKPALRLIQNIVGRIEHGDTFEELSEIFKDEYGNMILPIDRARQIIKQLEDNSGEFEQGLLNFVNSIGSVTLFLENANQNDFAALRALAAGNREDVNKAIKESAVLMRTVLQWENWLDSIQPIISASSFQNTTILKERFAKLRDAVNHTKERVNKISVDVLSKEFSHSWATYNATVAANLKAGKITQAQHDGKLVTPQSITNTLFGKSGDVSGWAYVENHLMGGDDILSSIGSMVEKTIISANNKSRDRVIDLNTALKPLQDKLGISDEKIGEQITYLDKINTYEKNAEGNTVMVQKDALTFLNPFKNIGAKKVKQNDLKVLRDKLYTTRNEFGKDSVEAKTLEAEYDAQYKAYKSWEQTNWHREMATEPWEIYQSFGLTGEDLDRATEAQEVLYEERRALRSELRSPNVTETDQLILTNKIEEVSNRLKNLRNPFDVANNRMKVISDNPEEDIRVAKVLKEKHIIDRQMYNYQVNVPKFLKDVQGNINKIQDEAVKRTLLGMLDTSDPEWLKKLMGVADSIAPYSFVEWLENNTRVMYSENFYESRKAIIQKLKEQIAELSKLLPSDRQLDLVSLNAELQNKWEDIMNMSSSLRDEDGIFDASSSNLEHQQLIKSAEVMINDLKGQIKSTSQIEKIGLSEEELAKKRQLHTAISSTIDALMNIQEKNPTEYYHDTMYEKLRLIYPIALGRVFPGENFLQLIDTEEFNTWLRSAAPADFREWFDANHSIKTTIDLMTGEVDSYYQPTYIWMKISPTNEKDVLLVPSYKYGDREFKDSATIEYKDTKKFFQLKTVKDANTWDENMNEWLPKSNEYRNQAYFDLQRSKPTMFQYLETVRGYHLDTQKDAPRSGKLGNTVPYMEKKFVDGGGFNAVARAVGNRINPVESGDANKANAEAKKTIRERAINLLRGWAGQQSEEQEAKEVKTDLLGNPIQSIFTSYSHHIAPNMVTRDTMTAVVGFAEAMNKTKGLVDSIATLNLTEQILEQYPPLVKNAKNQHGAGVKSSGNIRLNIVRNIKQNKLYGNNKEFELGVGVDTASQYLRNITTFFSQSITNPANALKNALQGHLTNLVSSGVVDWANEKSIAKATKSAKTNFISFASELGKPKKSLDFQIITAFNLSLTERVTELYNQNAAKRHLGGNAFFLSSEASEFGVLTTLLYGHLYHKKITINGETKDLYDAFHLVNGKLAMKENAYDGDRLIDEDYLVDLILKAKVISEHVQGKQFVSTYAQRFTLWKNLEFFKTYFIPKVRERFGVNRKNAFIGDDIEGFYKTTWKRFMAEILSLTETGGMSGVALTDAERRARRLVAKDIAVMLATYFILSFLYGYDDDDKERFKKLASHSWLYNFSLQILINAKKETDSTSLTPFFNVQENLVPPILGETYNYIKSPFVGNGPFEQLKKLADASFAHVLGGDGAYYQKDMPQYNIEEGDSKAGRSFRKLFHIDDFFYLMNPNYKIQVQQQMLNLQ